ncbi:hypothetical protein ACNUCX_08300 [Curtobacterium flaccumfaciens pv. flaccumfaciens]|uniref:hypothetical protein n=1 Tax=Curtobacterium flaccumfaciens TaxID=2035 RepID=UPI003AB3D990
MSVRRRASRVVSIGVVAALAASLTGCGEGAGVSSRGSSVTKGGFGGAGGHGGFGG